VREIAAAMKRYRRTIVVMGSQMGKTSTLVNEIGRQLDDSPANLLYVGPTRDFVSTVVEPVITAMLKSSKSLWAGTVKGHSAQKLSKTVNGVTLRLAWAGSPTQLASAPARTVLVDEIDRMKPIPGEGNPLTLAEARTSNFANGRILVTSTPTEGNIDVEKHPLTGIEHWKVADMKDLKSPIWKLWQSGTRHEWAVPCPECKQYFIPRFRHVLPTIPENATAAEARREARLACPACGALIEDCEKAAMNAAGHFLAPGQDVVDGVVVGDIPESATASYWVSGLMSPWKSFGDRAAEWVTAIATADQETIRGICNTNLGELYSFHSETPPPATVRECCAAYMLGEVPAGVMALTAFIDVQKRRLIYAVRGWGLSMESWLVDCGEIWGETSEPIVWGELEELLEREYGIPPHAFRIRLMGIDSGYRPGDSFRRPDNIIYEFCMRHRGVAVATKGRDRLEKPLSPSMIDVTMRGQTYKQGLQLWSLDTDFFKGWLLARLTWPEGQPGRWWVPQDVTDDYCSQLTSETRVAKPSGAATWVKIRPENHLWDCETGNAALAQILGFHRRLATPENKAATESGTVEAEQPPSPAPAPRPRRAPPIVPPGFTAHLPNWSKNWRR
jgi:phage terminase large subunit GpA-like protein